MLLKYESEKMLKDCELQLEEAKEEEIFEDESELLTFTDISDKLESAK